ncbi:MAG: restriction endonuclease, partial [Prevotellaceae bacterium]|nr:restriction endonuclease [Candidatus Colivivens equi]
KMLSEKFDFYAITAHPNEDAKAYIKEHFQDVLGKIYTPFNDKAYFSLALDKTDPEKNNAELLDELRKHFFVEQCGIGADPSEALSEIIAAERDKYTVESGKDGVLMVMMENFAGKCVNFLPQGKIAIGIKYTKDSMEIVEHLSEIGFLLFHIRKDEGQHLFKVKGKVSVLPKEEVDNSIYRNISTAEMYAVVDFETIDLSSPSLHSSKKPYTPETRYDAQYASIYVLS